MTPAYDQIGTTYATRRQPDPRIAAQIHAALGDAQTVLNVGAGTGSYEPAGRQVTALEPSSVMIAQRPHGAAPAVQGAAENLPFADNSFDAVMATLTIHHWADKAQGCSEMRRVSRGPIVVLTFDRDFRGFWLADYFPELVLLDDAQMPPLDAYARWLGPVDITAVPIPHDCVDGFLCAYWRRPEAYLHDHVRAGMSSFHRIGGVEKGVARLRADLESGAWQDRYGHLMNRDAADFGYRLVVARGG